jgi:Protein of unknown function (DUF1207)
MSSSARRLLLALALVLAHPPGAPAQQRLFPQVPSFELPEASPRVHGLVGRLLAARRGDSRFGREGEAEVALGENIPLLALRRGPRPITLGFGSQVYARFSITDPKSALISNDWVVGFNGTAVLDAWSLTLELYHESSHLGDEYEDHFNATRLDWTREVAVGWASYSTGPWRLTGSFSYTLVDQLGLERPGSSVGVDYRTKSAGRFLGSTVRPVAGVFFDANAATAWRVSSSAKAGVAFETGPGGKEIGFALIGHTGLSTQRQFYREESRYIGVEVRFDL